MPSGGGVGWVGLLRRNRRERSPVCSGRFMGKESRTTRPFVSGIFQRHVFPSFVRAVVCTRAPSPFLAEPHGCMEKPQFVYSSPSAAIRVVSPFWHCV